MIILKPLGGLCNRLRAIDSAINLSQTLSKKLVVIWIINPALNCPLSELLLPSKQFTLLETKLDISNIRDWRYFFLVDRNRRFGFINSMAHSLRRILFDKVIELEELDDLLSKGYDFTRLRSFRKIYICTYNHFYRPKELFSHFVLTDELAQIVDAVSSRFDQYTIGVHIRRGDSKKSVLYSPLEAFISQMNSEIANAGRTSFYLATDCQTTDKRLKELFGSRIISFDREYGRDTCRGIKDAVVDLYCLSRTAKLIGSYWSSFSNTAAELSGIEKTIIKRPDSRQIPSRSRMVNQ
jgi:hypothetical protein